MDKENSKVLIKLPKDIEPAIFQENAKHYSEMVCGIANEALSDFLIRMARGEFNKDYKDMPRIKITDIFIQVGMQGLFDGIRRGIAFLDGAVRMAINDYIESNMLKSGGGA